MQIGFNFSDDRILRFPKGAKHKIVKDLLKPELSPQWNVEMAILSRLIKKYPEPDFWIKFTLPFKLNSLAWLQGDGKSELEKSYWLYKLDWRQKTFNVEGETKVGEDYRVSTSRKSLKEILQS